MRPTRPTTATSRVIIQHLDCSLVCLLCICIWACCLLACLQVCFGALHCLFVACLFVVQRRCSNRRNSRPHSMQPSGRSLHCCICAMCCAHLELCVHFLFFFFLVVVVLLFVVVAAGGLRRSCWRTRRPSTSGPRSTDGEQCFSCPHTFANSTRRLFSVAP